MAKYFKEEKNIMSGLDGNSSEDYEPDHEPDKMTTGVEFLEKQGRIHGYRSRVRVGRGSILGQWSIWAGAVRSKK